ncbi:MAG: class I SAM-dependent methyltransferase [Endozoicomonas sp.]
MQLNTTVFHRSAHLDEGRLELSDTGCPFCNSTSRKCVHTLQEKPVVKLLQCRDCHAVSASRMPSEQVLSEYYGGYYDSPNLKSADSQVTFDKPESLARNIAEIYCRSGVEGCVTVMDFGGGDGTIACLLAGILIEQGAEQVSITVVDYHPSTVEPDDPRICIDSRDSLEQVTSQYDIVIASAVIEHYPRPGGLVQDLLGRMKPGAMFYARTPCMAPIIRLFRLVGIKVDFSFPGHIHDLGQDFWENYFSGSQSETFQILASRPSIVESSFKKHFLRTLLAILLKMPWYLFGRHYKFVGGWEVFVRKNL